MYKHLKYKELEHNAQVLLMFEKGCVATPNFGLGDCSKGATMDGRCKNFINE